MAFSDSEIAVNEELGEICAAGRSRYAEHRLNEACALFQRARSLGPLPPDELIFKIRTEYRLNMFSEAMTSIDELLIARPNHAEALKTAGRIANIQKDAALARDFWTRLAKADPVDPDGPLQLARIAERDENFVDAIAWGRRLLTAVPEHPEGLSIVATAAIRSGELDGIGTILAAYSVADRERALKLLSQLPMHEEPEIYADALASFRDRVPGDAYLSVLVQDTVETFLEDGIRGEIASRDIEAAKFYRAIRRIDEGNANAEVGLERLRRPLLSLMRDAFRQQRPDKVIEHGRRAVEIDPQCLEALMMLGRTCFYTEDFVQARNCFERAAKFHAKESWAWLNLARTLDRLEEWGDALKAYRHVIALSGNDNSDRVVESERAIRALYAKSLFAGRDAVARADFDAAWMHCTVAIDIDPSNESAQSLRRSLLGSMHARIRELWQDGSPGAIDLCREYLDRSPDNVYVLQVYGRTLMNNRRYAEARPAWAHLARLNPEDVHFHLQIARCCNWLKQREDGIAAAQEALRLDPQLAEATAIIRQLEAIPSQG